MFRVVAFSGWRLFFVVRCLLSVVCCLLLVHVCSLVVVCCVLFVDYWLYVVGC